MNRRQFIAAAGAAAMTSTQRTNAAEGDGFRRIAVLMLYAESDPLGRARLGAFKDSLSKIGWIDGKNVGVEVRWSGADLERGRHFARELVASRPDVIVATSTPTTAALRHETSSIPIVFTVVSDPVGEGFVRSLARPGGNVTGFVNFEPSMTGKWLSLLREIDPRISKAAGLFNPDVAPDGGSYFARAFEAAGRDISIRSFLEPIRRTAEISKVIAKLADEPGAGLVVMADSFMGVHRATVIEQAARYRVPAVYPFHSAPAEGGLFSYGPDISELFRQVAPYVDRILRGAQPSELPVQAPTKFELVINLKTAKSLGLEVPKTLLTRADELIE